MVNPQRSYFSKYRINGDNIVLIGSTKEVNTMIKPLIYRDVDPNRYLISDKGEIFKVSGKKLNGCNPDNEKGYVRVTLVTNSGKLKKYAIHRLVLAVFTYDSDLEVDHKNGNKRCNELWNLEYVTGDINKRRAADMCLYQSCEDHYKAVLSNDQVRQICELYEKGYNPRKVMKILDLKNTRSTDEILIRILHRKGWTKISKDYKWEIDDVRLKVYKHKHLLSIGKLIKCNKYTSKEIAKMFPQYDQKKLIQVIKKMRQGKLYRSILEEVERSTTIIDEIRDGDDFIILVPRRC